MNRHPSLSGRLHLVQDRAGASVDLGAERERRRITTIPMAFAIVASTLGALPQADVHRVLSLVAAHRGISLVKTGPEDAREAAFLAEFVQ